ncbi:MAG: 4-hydroxybutyrate CoA-transferase [Desulfobulbaceae bacterium]|jgi:acyl-CoA hydrolase/GNAT superfamily N-acetyltransferase|nr:4-hydroxybutyrate CoA-transferase [Desulfobulbaceae bacterium]
MNTQNFAGLDNNWQDRYATMLCRARRALRRVRSGDRVFIGTGSAEPLRLVEALVARAPELVDVEIVQLFTKGEAAYADEKLTGSFRLNSFYIGKNVREAIQAGLGSYTPISLSAAPALFRSGKLPLDVALVQVSPPDADGWMSLGISVDIVKSAIENASLVIAQVNKLMPWTEGDSLVNIHDLDLLVAADMPLLLRESRAAHPTAREIGRRVAALVPDGATIQFGLGRSSHFGSLPQATCEFLSGHRDLGIHTEMITEDIVPLIESGAVNGRCKSSDRGRVVTSFCIGGERLYRMVERNPLFCFRPTEFVSNAEIIARQTRMVAINTAHEIDLTGQVCADSEQGQLTAGVGGLVDFARGALQSPGGRSIIVLPATSPDGQRSNIVTQLPPGAGVTLGRAETQFIVTEYGVADLFGKTIEQRVLALIGVANPRFRAGLFQEAMTARLLRPEMSSLADCLLPPLVETSALLLLDDGTEIRVRPLFLADLTDLRLFLHHLSPTSRRYHCAEADEHKLPFSLYADSGLGQAVVATIPDAHGEEIVATGKYFREVDGPYAEISLLVRDDWQNRGIGGFMFRRLCELAKGEGLAGLKANIRRENQRMQAILQHAGPTSGIPEGDVYRFQVDFRDDAR